jgi:CRISPR-associated protein Cmr1
MPRKVEIPFQFRFITPAFLGGADQGGEWRVPPLRHLLREWWRCLAMGQGRAAGNEPDTNGLRSAEVARFGGVHDDAPQRSQVELFFLPSSNRATAWAKGAMNDFPRGNGIRHSEVGPAGRSVDAFLYLGYGPLLYGNANHPVKLKQPPAIAAGDEREAVIRCPKELEGDVRDALRLTHWLGTVGGRCRNGWGSIDILDDRGQAWCSSRDLAGLTLVEKNWEQCLKLDWSHAVGVKTGDQPIQPLVWRTKGGSDTWQGAMNELANCKIAVRAGTVGTLGPIPVGGINQQPNERHLLGYPITHHDRVARWSRLASQLRFKVAQERLAGDAGPKYYGIAYHMPHGLPKTMRSQYPQGTHFPDYDVTVWRKVHAKLDALMTPWTTP